MGRLRSRADDGPGRRPKLTHLCADKVAHSRRRAVTRKLQVGKALSCPARPLFSCFFVARGIDVPTGLHVATLCAACPPGEGSYGSRKCLWWDFPGPFCRRQVNVPVRVVRSQGIWRVRRELDGKDDKPISEWIRVTTLPQQSIPTGRRRHRLGAWGWRSTNWSTTSTCTTPLRLGAYCRWLFWPSTAF